MDKSYCYKDYFKPTDEEVQLKKDYKAATKKEEKAKIKKKLMALRGITYQQFTDEDGNTTGSYSVSEKKFTEYLLAVFCVVYICISSSFPNPTHHLSYKSQNTHKSHKNLCNISNSSLMTS